MLSRPWGMAESVPARLRKLRARVPKLSIDALAKEMGYEGASSIQRYFDDAKFKDPYLKVDLAEKFAAALAGKGSPKITRGEVLTLAGIPSEAARVPVLREDGANFRLIEPGKLTPVPIIGAVQAGVWQDSVEWPPSEHYTLPMLIPTGFQGLTIRGLEVRGPSMDEIYPHGSVVVCAPFIELGRPPRSGERVVAIRTRAMGESEATIKEYRIDKDGKQRLWPRSTHPDFQAPIAIDAPRDEGEDLSITFLVIGSYRPEA